MIKKILLISGFIFSFIATDIFAQNKNSIKVAPLDVIVGIYGLGYERGLSNSASILLTARYTDFLRREKPENGSPLSIWGNKYKQEGFDLKISFRRYIRSETFLEGFYLEKGFVFASYDITYELKGSLFFGRDGTPDFIDKLNVYSASLDMGYQAELGNNFVLDFGFGIRINRVFNTSDPMSFPVSKRLNGFTPAGNLTLGYTF